MIVLEDIKLNRYYRESWIEFVEAHGVLPTHFCGKPIDYGKVSQ